MRDVSTRLVFGHSRRAFLWGSLQGEMLGLDYDTALLFARAVFHALGLLAGHLSEHERFEIEGANAARVYPERDGVPDPAGVG